MEPTGLLLCSQHTVSILTIKPVHALPFYLFKIYFSVILCSWATSVTCWVGSYIIMIMIKWLCVCVHAHVYVLLIHTRAQHYLVCGLCPSFSFFRNNTKWMHCCYHVKSWMGRSYWVEVRRDVVGACLLTLPSNDKSRSVSKAAQWVQQWLDCLLAAVSMPWSMLGSPQHDLATLYPFQKHLVCRQNIHSITVNIWNGQRNILWCVRSASPLTSWTVQPGANN